MSITELVEKFVIDIIPYLDETFDSIIIDFKKDGRNYQIAILDDSDFNEMMNILNDAYRKRYDNLSDEEKRKFN
jgi:hypothetical protein